MRDELRDQVFSSPKELKDFLDLASQILVDARETEPLLRNAMKYVKSKTSATQLELSNAFDEYL